MGYINPKTFGSAMPVYPYEDIPAPSCLINDVNTHSEPEKFVVQAICNQRTMMKSIFRGVTDWKSFGTFLQALKHRCQSTKS